MVNGNAPVRRVEVTGRGAGVTNQSGTHLLGDIAGRLGIAAGMSGVIAGAVTRSTGHDRGRVFTQVAMTLAAGGRCLADLKSLRNQPGLFGAVASDPTAWRAVHQVDDAALAAMVAVGQDAIRRLLVACDIEDVVLDVDATLVTAHSDKEQARATFKRGYGHHPLWAFADHGQNGTGEPLAVLLRPGNAGSNTAADHITVVRDALRQLPGHQARTRPGRKVLVRIDGAGATHALLDWLVGQRLSYSVGFGLPAHTADLLAMIPEQVWQVAYDSDGGVREGAWVAELTGLLDLSGWPAGMRVIVRKERPHPGAQLRITDVNGLRVTAFATNTARGQLADLELRHRRRARCEDRIRNAKDTGLTNLPLHDMDQNRIWCALVSLACELTAWLQMLSLPGLPARRWEPKRLRLRLFSVAGRLARSGRRTVLHLSRVGRWTNLLLNMINTLRALPAPG